MTESELANESAMMEQKYNVYLWVGILLNVFTILFYEVVYGKLCMTTNPKSQRLYIVSYLLMNTMALTSGIFLGIALYRIWKTFKDMRGLLQNEKVILLHLVMFVFYMFVTLFKTFQISEYFRNPQESSKYRLALISYVMWIWSCFFDELILCYLFIKFSAPATQVI